MRKIKKAAISICESRKIAMPDEINPHGTLFGGVMMSWIDKVGYMCAQNYAEWKKTVTANIDQISFYNPVFSGDHVVLKAYVAHVGKSSMQIDVHVTKEDPVLKNKTLVADAYMTFVSINQAGKGKLVPELILETDEEFERNAKAQIRIQMRKELIFKLASIDPINRQSQYKIADSSLNILKNDIIQKIKHHSRIEKIINYVFN